MSEPEVQAAMIALIGVILSLVINILFHVGQTKYNYNQLYAQTVTDNRMDWINVWRMNISKFLACAELLMHSCDNNASKKSTEKDDSKRLIEYEKEFYESRTMITSRLNMQEELHVLMFAAINQIDFHTPDQFEAKREYILELAREILKIEWERLKEEALGKRK